MGVSSENESWTMTLLTIGEAAELLRVKISWLYDRTRTNEVPHLKLGKYLRFDRDELLAWARQFQRDGGGRGRLRLRSEPADGQEPARRGRPLG